MNPFPSKKTAKEYKLRPAASAAGRFLCGTAGRKDFFNTIRGEAVDKEVNSPQRKGRVCAGNPRGVSRAIKILSFQNFYEVLKTCSAGEKRLFRHAERDTPFGVSLLIFLRMDVRTAFCTENAAVCFCVNDSGCFAGAVVHAAGVTAVRYAAICVKRVVSSSRALTSWLTCSFSIVVWVAMA